MPYCFYLDELQLPVAPQSLVISLKNQNRTVNLINEGEVNILKAPGLSDISFKAVLPQTPQAFSSAALSADCYIARLDALKRSRAPFRFIVTRTLPGGSLLFDTNLQVSLEDCKIVEDAADGFDITVQIRLKEYRDCPPQILSTGASGGVILTPQAQKSTDAPAPPATYTVKKGDCLYNIAAVFLGNGARYIEIYNLNKAAIDARNKGTGNPKYTIYPGQVLTINS